MNYTEKENVSLVSIRWFIENCMEIKLANGKTIVVDPMIIRDAGETDNEIAKSYVTGYSADDLEGCDYIILTHIHGDHIGALKQVHERFPNAPVLVNGWSAWPLAKYLDMPLGAFIPMTDGCEYDFDGFKIKWLQGRHTPAVGAMTPSQFAVGGSETEQWVNRLGTIYNSNFILFLENSMTLAMDGGRYEPNLSRLDLYKPNIVFCHSMKDLNATAETFCDALTRSGAQYLFPLCAQIQGEGTETAIRLTNEKLQAAGYPGRALNPKCGKWIDFSMGLSARL